MKLKAHTCPERRSFLQWALTTSNDKISNYKYLISCFSHPCVIQIQVQVVIESNQQLVEVQVVVLKFVLYNSKFPFGIFVTRYTVHYANKIILYNIFPSSSTRRLLRRDISHRNASLLHPNCRMPLPQASARSCNR